MTRIAFIGLGNMGGGMAANQAKAGHEVLAFDLSAAALEKAVAAGCREAGSAAAAVKDADAVFTMLPAGQHVRAVYPGEILPNAKAGALLIDCSTIDVESARAVAKDVLPRRASASPTRRFPGEPRARRLGRLRSWWAVWRLISRPSRR